MPNAKTHAAIGITAGSLIALLASRELPPEARLAITVAGGVGGYAGGALPDIIEPAKHPWHRDFFHSATVGGGVLTAGVKAANSGWVKGWLTEAAALRERRLQLPLDHPDRTSLGLQEFFLYALAGAFIGLVAGYVSHLVADATTSRSIGVIGRST